MNKFELIKCSHGSSERTLFDEFPKLIYPEGSQRFVFGNEPSSTFLEGCYLLFMDNKPVGRFAFYENPNLKYKGKNSAAFGSYECINNLEIGIKLINYAIDLGRQKQYDNLIGPMEGSTWENYRFSNNHDFPNFFMEPYHHLYYNDHFKKAGLDVISEYVSNLDKNLNYDEEKLIRFEKIYKEKGAQFRKLDLNDLVNELSDIAALSLDGFVDNFLYSPISIDDFIGKYKKLETYFDPELIWMVEDENSEMQAFIFGIKDYFDPLGETLIIKSVVIKKSSKFKGIGTYLAGKLVQLAKNSGYRKIIHAMMINDNQSIQISKKHTGTKYKSYSLYGLKL